jgi:hypothetical protein
MHAMLFEIMIFILLMSGGRLLNFVAVRLALISASFNCSKTGHAGNTKQNNFCAEFDMLFYSKALHPTMHIHC